MSEKLIIKNFGPIKHVELELKKFNVLIGDNATGKSTVAKVLTVCRYFSYIIDGSSYSFYDSIEKGLYDHGMGEMIQDKSYIFYECGNYIFSTQRSTRKVPARDQENGEEYEYEEPCFDSKLIAKSERFQNLLNELKKIEPNGYQILNDSERWIPTSFYQNDVARVMDNPVFLPTERGLQSIFSLGKSTIQNISDSLFNQLADLDRIAREFKSETTIEPLNIVYKNVNGRGYFRKIEQNDFFSLENGASGYQSTIPVILVTKYYINNRKQSKTFIVEEPELNLFPAAQSKLMTYLVDKTINYNNQILLTTHSPYILTSLNNLMYAYNVGQNNEEDVADIVGKKYWLNPDDVSAYRLLPDGTAKNILDAEIKQIDAGELDGISRTINETWDKIADIELAQSMKINLDDYPFEYGKAVSNPTALENGRSFTLNNESGFTIKKWLIDKVIFRNRTEERCDFLILVEGKAEPIYFWIELKGSDAMKACKQVLSAISLIMIEGRAIQEARIITTKTPAPAFRNNAYARLDKHVRLTGGQLKIYTNRGSEKI